MLLTSDLLKLKNIQIYLEKPENVQNFLMKYSLLDFYSDVESQRKIAVEKANKDVIELVKSLIAKRELLRNGVDNLDLKAFKKDMITTQEIIYNLKSDLKRKMEKFELDEREITDQVKAFNQKILEWEKPVPLKFENSNKKSTTSITFNTKEVKDFMDFLIKSHGHEGGWVNDDHLLFLKFRTKFKGDIEKVAFNVHKLLPDISEDSVRQHEEWYKEYLFLKERRKEALENWRKIKNEACEVQEQITGTQEIAKKKNQPKDVREKLALWKNEKVQRKQREEEYMLMMKQRMKESQASKLKMQEEVKLSVEKWKQAKLEQDQEMKMKKEHIEMKEKHLKAAEANKMIKKFRSQDDLYIVKIQQIKKPKEKIEIKRSKSSQIRNPKRIFQPTKQWLSRTDHSINSEPNSIPVIPNIKCVPKLGIPEWRRHQGTRF